MTTQALKVQGHNVNNAVIAAFHKRVTSQSHVLSVWANAAAIQATQGNLNWAERLFSALSLKSGELSKQGKSVLSYIQRHYPLLVWDKENKKIGRKKQNADSVFNTLFLAPTATEQAEGFQTLNGKTYLPVGDFELTYDQFLNLERPAKLDDGVQPSLPVKTFIKQTQKALEAATASRLVGSVEEFGTAIAEAEALVAKLRAAQAASISAQAAAEQRVVELANAGPAAEISPEHMPVDAAAAAQLLQSGQGGKSTRAPKKVA